MSDILSILILFLIFKQPLAVYGKIDTSQNAKFREYLFLRLIE